MLFADQGDPENLDPQAMNTRTDTNFLAFPGNAYETLVGFDPESGGEVSPWLATEIPSVDNGLIRDGGRVYEFPLREGVIFHTGDEMTAEDVKFTYDRVTTMGLSPEVGIISNTIDSVEVLDTYRVQFNLANPSPAFLRTVAARPPLGVISKQAVEEHGGVEEGRPNEWVTQNTAGTGPYKADEWRRGTFIEWVTHRDYWQEGMPKTWRIVQQAVPRLATRTALIQRGDAHLIEASAEALSEVQDVPNTDILFTEAFDPAHITMNFETPYDEFDDMPDDTVSSTFFADPKIRQAFGYAMDYQAYIDQVWNGHANRISQYQLKGTFAYDPDAPNFERDPEKAEQLFKEAGVWSEGFTIHSFNEDIPEFTGGNLILKDSIESLNDKFTIRVVSIPEARYAQLAGGAQRYHFALSFGGFLGLGPDPSPYYENLYLPGGSYADRAKVFNHVSDELKQTIREASAEIDENRRRELYHQLQRMCFEEPAAIAISQEQFITVHRKCVEAVNEPTWVRWHMKHFDISNCNLR